MNRLIQCGIFLIASYATTAAAQRCGATCANAEALLGLSEQTLRASIPELQRAPKPVQGPRNTRGKWVLQDFHFATQPYTVTYFIGAGQVTRIELLSNAPTDQCTQRIAFQLALAELGKTYGESQVFGSFEDGGKSAQSVAFNSETVDVALHFSQSTDACTTRVIYNIRQVKNASEL